MSRLVIAVWLVLLCVSFVGCGGDTTPESATPATAPQASEPSAKAEAESEPEEQPEPSIATGAEPQPEPEPEPESNGISSEWKQRLEAIPDEFLVVYVEASRIIAELRKRTTDEERLKSFKRFGFTYDPNPNGSIDDVRMPAPPPAEVMAVIEERLNSRKKPMTFIISRTWASGPTTDEAMSIWNQAADIAKKKHLKKSGDAEAGTTAATDTEPQPEPEPKSRTWTDTTGKFGVEAQFIDIKDGKVQLKKKSGSVLSVPLEKLSEGDRGYLTQTIEQTIPDEWRKKFSAVQDENFWECYLEFSHILTLRGFVDATCAYDPNSFVPNDQIWIVAPPPAKVIDLIEVKLSRRPKTPETPYYPGNVAIGSAKGKTVAETLDIWVEATEKINEKRRRETK